MRPRCWPGCGLGAVLGRLHRLYPDPHGPTLWLIDIERSGLSDEIAEFPIAISARVEVGDDVCEALPYRAQAHPPVLGFHLGDSLVQGRNGRAGGLESLEGAPFLRCRNLGL